MIKSEALEHLRAAKAAHIRWVQRAKLVIEGFQVEKDAIPVDCTMCNFGKWFYSEAQKLNNLRNNNLECMSTIEQLHFKIHDLYLNIFRIYFDRPEGGFFSKLFGFNKKTISDEARSLAKVYYTEMEGVSRQLVDEIAKLERRILAISDHELAELE